MPEAETEIGTTELLADAFDWFTEVLQESVRIMTTKDGVCHTGSRHLPLRRSRPSIRSGVLCVHAVRRLLKGRGGRGLSMYSEFEQSNVAIILKAMILQGDDGEWEVLNAQHAKCAPIVRLYGSAHHLEQLEALESRMRSNIVGGHAISDGVASA
ncbi:hypothetical protein QA648_10925 [Rhizobium sp. CB3171]|uniref:hypothetical protein n=1 Tax=Rhizobium sp. CB3171 TaxID=3039157 RepID=UPI0024B1707A|nr:hypothetical protein [Rhizobium sp. CB3171]WFU00684.1 hypothetical protein QA648_10925 [Rhizobium sp. CB3171]